HDHGPTHHRARTTAADHGGGAHRGDGDAHQIRVRPGLGTANGIQRGTRVSGAGTRGPSGEMDRPAALRTAKDGSGDVPRSAGSAAVSWPRVISNSACRSMSTSRSTG